MNIEANAARPLPFVLAWAGLLVLAGISIVTAFLRLGAAAPAIELGIAAMQAAVLFLLFMRLLHPPALKWLFAGAGFFWLMLLYGLSMTDYASRQGWPNH